MAPGVAAACAPREQGKDSGQASVPPGKIEHIIMVMMENRSFDHRYGARSLHEGRSDEDGLEAGMGNSSPGGVDVPVFHATELCPNDPPHGWSSSHDQFNGGACDGFARVHGDSYGTDGAEAMGTWPNRLYGQMGSNQVDATRGRVIEELCSALESGDLPPVVWVDPAFSYNDNHPPHHPALGELFLAAVHESLATSPLSPV